MSTKNSLRYQNSSAEFPEQYISTYASTAFSGKVTFCTVAPLSSATAKKFGRVGDKFDKGIIMSDVDGVGNLRVGA